VETFQRALDSAAKDSNVSAIDVNFVRKFYDRVVPGIYTQFDALGMLPLIAPRPLLVINGDSDARTPRPGLMETSAAALKAYEAMGASDRYVLRLQENTGHQVRPASLEFAVEWLTKWLQP